MTALKDMPGLSPADWNARWVWDKPLLRQDDNLKQQIRYFRRCFSVNKAGAALRVNVSADSRYRLYINGQSVAFGPCKGHLWAHHYETVDLTPYLQPGKNVLAAKVVHLPDLQPASGADVGAMSVRRAVCGAFILEGTLRGPKGEPGEVLDTDSRWKVLADEAICQGKVNRMFYAGPPEVVDASLLPKGWELPDYDDANWSAAVPLIWAHRVSSDSYHYGEVSPWPLMKRPIPPLYEIPRLFRRISRSSDTGWEGLLSGSKVGEKTIGADSVSWVELDAGLLTTGFLELTVDGGKGSSVEILTSECYESRKEPRKGIRDDASFGELMGDSDIYHPSGGFETYEPFWFRAFRFVRLEVKTAREPICIKGFRYRETGYPLVMKARFECSEPAFYKLWDISVNTLKRCMHETYEDCPYYEQLQYIMDTRLQAIFTYYTSGDDRLARKAIEDFHSSLTPMGLLQSRFPSHIPQIIPGFSLHWIGMLDDHYRYFGDIGLLKRCLGAVDAILSWFGRHIGDDGLLEIHEYWNFVDWVSEWSTHPGVPNSARLGPDAITSLMYSAALKTGANLNKACNRKDVALEYESLSKNINAAVRDKCWRGDMMLFSDGPGLDEFSQHAQVWAVLAGAAGTPEEARALMDKCLTEDSIAKCSYAMSFFLFRALEATGKYADSFRLWETWKDMAALHLTTWAEDPVNQRSDCHGWGSVPLYEFPAVMLGVKPMEPGYRKILVAPQPGSLSWAKGLVPTPVGDIAVEWNNSHRFKVTVAGPPGIPVTVRIPGRKEMTFPNGGHVTVLN